MTKSFSDFHSPNIILVNATEGGAFGTGISLGGEMRCPDISGHDWIANPKTISL